jgi:hypothetical protein
LPGTLRPAFNAGIGITVELLKLASVADVVAGLFVGTQSAWGGADPWSQAGIWSGPLVLEAHRAVPFRCSVPVIFRQLDHRTLLRSKLGKRTWRPPMKA